MRIFSINFNGGFAIVDNSTAMMNIINNEYSIVDIANPLLFNFLI